MLPAKSEMASAVDNTPEDGFTFCLPSRVMPPRSSLKMVHTLSTTSSWGIPALSSRLPASCSTLDFTISISVDISDGGGRITMLNLRFRAADISLTPLSLVLAVAMTENPFWAGSSSASSGMEMRFSDKMEINASCTSLAHLDISSKRAMLPVSMARYTGLFIIASLDGPWAMSMA